MNIPERLDQLRLQNGCTWEELGRTLGLSRTMLHYVRTGARSPSAKAMLRLREAEAIAGIAPPPTRISLPKDTRDAVMTSISQALSELASASPSMRKILALYIEQLAGKLKAIVRHEEQRSAGRRIRRRKNTN